MSLQKKQAKNEKAFETSLAHKPSDVIVSQQRQTKAFELTVTLLFCLLSDSPLAIQPEVICHGNCKVLTRTVALAN
jgi:hypothetical protein